MAPTSTATASISAGGAVFGDELAVGRRRMRLEH